MGASRTKSGDKLKAAEVERARCAWVIACDVATREFGGDFRKVVQTKGTAGKGSDAVTTLPRKVACYLATVVANCTGARLAEATGMDRSTIHVHAQWVEDQREDARFDQVIGTLEDRLFNMALRVVLARLGAPVAAEVEEARALMLSAPAAA